VGNRIRALTVRLIIAIVGLGALGAFFVFDQPTQVQADRIGPGGALAVKRGPKDLRGYVRVIDGDTLDVYLDGQRVPVGVIGVRTPQGNTDCGIQAAQQLRQLVKGGVRLEEDSTLAIDGRFRRMYRAVTLDGRSIADDLVRNGFAKTDGKGDYKRDLAQAESDASSAAQGCIWKDGLPADLRAPSFAPPDPTDQQGLIGANSLDEAFGMVGSAMGNLLAVSQPLQPQPVEAQSGPLPASFTQDTLLSSGLTEPTNFAFLPDGRILIAQKHGVVLVYKNGALLPTPFIDISDRVNDYFDHGLIGIAVDPNFATNNYVYLLYTYENDINQYSGSKTGRLARYTANGDTASPASEFVVLGHWVGPSCEGFPAGYDCLPSDNLSHSVGTMQFAPDGSMYVTSGDGASYSVVDPLALRAQNLSSLGGKIMHIDPATGNGFATNPFYSGDVTANQSKIWDYGLRNPFRFALRPTTNVPYIGQVGWNTWEDLYVGKPGKNFGWPCYEGNFVQDGYSAYAQCQSLYSAGTRTAPTLSYAHYGGSTAIVAGFFYTGNNFPASYLNRFFYSDYGHGWINSLQVDTNDNLVANSVTTFLTEPNGTSPTALKQGPDGYLYYVTIVPGEFRRIRYIDPNSPPTVVVTSDVTNGLLPLTVNFSSAGTLDPNGRPLTYAWTFGDGGTSTQANPSHTYTTAGTFTAKLTATNNVPTSNSAQVDITAGSRPPTAHITAPASSLLYKVGDTIDFSGSGADYNGSPIPASGLSWTIIAHHCPQGSCHTHFLETATGASGSVVVPDHGDNVYLELQLTATNSAGLSDTDSVSVNPQLVTLTFNSVPTGMSVVYDGQSGTTPRTQQTVINSQHTLFTTSPQANGQATFASWSDGGAQQHNITTPATDTSYAPTFNVTPPTPRSLSLNGTSYAETLITPGLNILGDWTLEAWFKDTASTSYNHGDTYIAIKGDTNASGEAPYLMGISWNNLFVGTRTGYVTSMVTYNLTNAGLTWNAWHHAAATYQASTRTLTLFLDGSQVAQGVQPAFTTTGNGLAFEIGRNGTTGALWTGNLDDVRVWNVRRTQAQIAANLNNEYIGAPTGLVGNWRFNEASGTTSADYAGQATANLSSGATFSTDVHGAAAPTPTATLTPTPGPSTATPTVTPTLGPVSCPCTIWPGTASPVNAAQNDPSAIELGVKFQPDRNGFITGVRYYKSSPNTGTHVGNLWSSTGTLLASATFTGESGSGWQQVNFSSPVAVTANTTYVASYHTNTGFYAADQNSFATNVGNAPVRALASAGNGGNGVYMYGSGSAFPTNSFNSTNYWVDVVFNTSAQLPTATPTPPATPTNTPAPPTGTPTPTNTPAPVTCPCTIWPGTASPVNAAQNDPSAIELGVKFQPDRNGFITGVRYYKSSSNTGTHVGNLWSSTGTLLASATFTGESGSGWQQVNFSSPVAVTANTTYVASYHTNTGFYAADQNSFATNVGNAPVRALASAGSGDNGVYMYGSGSAFPTNSFNSTNYWVDVVFNTSAQLPTATPTPPAAPTSTPMTCPCTVFPSNAVPSVVANPDTSAVELGMKFTPDVNGHVTGARFYKSSTNTGTHTARLWTSTGTLLATATFSGETASGWQQVSFPSPVAVTAGTTYVVSYHTNTGNYSSDQGYFNNPVDRSPLHAPTSASSGGNGVYMYGATSAFPSNTYSASNYWVDVVFVSP
jgi:glucose/arabinose dehydrogenase/endonuclease YncB( thermonuclease family)